MTIAVNFGDQVLSLGTRHIISREGRRCALLRLHQSRLKPIDFVSGCGVTLNLGSRRRTVENIFS